jgi:glycine betaine/proline transport system substrate-binding protein
MSDSSTRPHVPSADGHDLASGAQAEPRPGRGITDPTGRPQGQRTKHAAVAVLLAAIIAVGLWSLKPVLISSVADRVGFAEVYVVSGFISVLASAAGVLVLRRPTLTVARGGGRTQAGLGAAALSGLFLALWYYGFYRALYGAPTVDATIIAFTWPLVVVIAMRILSPSTAPKLALYQWLLVLVAFLGAAAISVADPADAPSTTGSGGEIVWAFVAAIGSGLYLPFAIKATQSFDHVIGSRPLAAFYAISVANATALAAVLLALWATRQTMRFGTFDAQVLLVCGLIGIGTYLVAEIAWTWAFAEHRSLTLASLPYFSPALSVVLLHLIFGEPVRPVAVVGLVLILLANLTLYITARDTTEPDATP